jgi:toxin ParE1/3/4
MRVVWSPLAVQRVYEQAEYIARDKPLAAERWVEGIFAAAERLKEFSFSGREVEEAHREEIREIVFGSLRRLPGYPHGPEQGLGPTRPARSPPGGLHAQGFSQ